MNRLHSVLWVLITLTAVSLADSAMAAFPENLSYSGFLQSPDGTPFDESVDVEVAFYDDVDEGERIWGETHWNVEVVHGWLSLNLGSVQPFDFEWTDETSLWLDLTVEGEHMSPRQPVTAVPFAFVAEEAVGGLADQLADHGTRLGDLEADTVTWAEVGSKPSWLDNNTVDWDEVGTKPPWLDNDAVDWGEVDGRPTDLDDGKLQWSNLEGIGTDLNAAFTDLADGLLTWSRLEGLPDLIGRFSDETKFRSEAFLGGYNIILEGVNLHLRNGLGNTWGVREGTDWRTGTTNGLGNLFIGYNELEGGDVPEVVQTGSHNLVIGALQRFYSFGSLIAGYSNELNQPYGIVAGGHNTVNGPGGSIAGGSSNQLQGDYASVAGGRGNQVNAENGTIAGGENNSATGTLSAIFGGSGNEALDDHATVLGGINNRAEGGNGTVVGGAGNRAGSAGTAVGGYDNHATTSFSTVAGGVNNRANGYGSAVLGGYGNVAECVNDVVAGGELNVAGEERDAFGCNFGGGDSSGASVLGGYRNTATGFNSVVAGGISNQAGYQTSTVTGGASLSSTEDSGYCAPEPVCN